MALAPSFHTLKTLKLLEFYHSGCNSNTHLPKWSIALNLTTECLQNPRAKQLTEPCYYALQPHEPNDLVHCQTKGSATLPPEEALSFLPLLQLYKDERQSAYRDCIDNMLKSKRGTSLIEQLQLLPRQVSTFIEEQATSMLNLYLGIKQRKRALDRFDIKKRNTAGAEELFTYTTGNQQCCHWQVIFEGLNWLHTYFKQLWIGNKNLLIIRKKLPFESHQGWGVHSWGEF